MSYTLINDEGAVILDADGSIVAPCQSVDEPAFVVYQAWIEAGNQPTVLTTRTVAQNETVEG